MVFPDVRSHIENGGREIPVEVNGEIIQTDLNISDRQRHYILAGGALNYVKKELKNN